MLTFGRSLIPWKGERRVLIVFLGLVVAALAFAKFISEVLEGDTLAFDRLVLKSLRNGADVSVPVGPAGIQQVMVDLTALGGVSALTLMTLLSVGYLFSSKRPAMAIFVGASIGAGALLSAVLKLLFLRARPDIVPHLVEVHSASFPSGHAMNSAVVFLTLGALLCRSEPRQTVRAYLIGTALLLTVIIGLTRLYLGVHWPTDVFVGWIVGASWAILSSSVAASFQRTRQLEPAQPHALSNPNGDLT